MLRGALLLDGLLQLRAVDVEVLPILCGALTFQLDDVPAEVGLHDVGGEFTGFEILKAVGKGLLKQVGGRPFAPPKA